MGTPLDRAIGRDVCWEVKEYTKATTLKEGVEKGGKDSSRD